MILIITPFFWPNVGGVETHLNDLCQYLAKKKYKVQVLTYQPITTKARARRVESKKNFEIIRFWWPGFDLFHRLEKLPLAFNFLYLTPGILINSIFFMMKNHHRVLVIHSHGLVAGLVGVILKKMFKKRLVISTHAIYGFHNLSFSQISARILNCADRVLALSEASKKELIEIGVDLPKITVYVHWVNQERFKLLGKIKCKNKLKLENKFVVLFVGRLIKIKGIGLLIEVAKQQPEITFVFAGAGPEEKVLKQEAKKRENIKFVGKIDNKYLPFYYNAADVLVIPSQYEEGYGRVILEALSCGTPVVGSNRGGIKEAISPEVGILIPPEVDYFSRTLRNLFLDRQKLRKMTKNCRSYALIKFSDKNGKLITDSYFK